MPMDDELLYRQLPHSLEAEQAVLGSMLIDAGCIKDVMEKLRSEDFYLRQNREVFETIQTMFLYNRPIDALTVVGEMERNGTYDDKTTRAYLAELMEVTPTSANVLEYADIVLDKSLLRAVARAAGDITKLVQDGEGGAKTVLEAAEQKIYAVRRGRSAQDLERIGPVLQGVLDRLAELSASDGKIRPGLPIGFSAIDDKTAGFGDGDLVILAARPGMGKSSLALNIALNVAKDTNKTVAVFSLEMSREQLVTRMLSNAATVELSRLLTGNLRESDWVKIANATAMLSPLDIRFDDNPMLSVADMNAKCRRLDDLALVVIDYLQLMNSAGGKQNTRAESRQQMVSDMSRMLKIMAKELGVPVLCLSQLTRANEKRDDKRPMLSDLRDSGSIEQDADIVLFIYRDDYYKEDSEQHNIAECIIAKNRHGSTGKVNLTWSPEYTTFSTYEGRYDEDDY
ncbi:MAG: replicative DNA helicase [Ruminococcaceae bacterium]|nr:replicative DNA helicase [Oscillospiraceae bacterium]